MIGPKKKALILPHNTWRINPTCLSPGLHILVKSRVRRAGLWIGYRTTLKIYGVGQGSIANPAPYNLGIRSFLARLPTTTLSLVLADGQRSENLSNFRGISCLRADFARNRLRSWDNWERLYNKKKTRPLMEYTRKSSSEVVNRNCAESRTCLVRMA